MKNPKGLWALVGVVVVLGFVVAMFFWGSTKKKTPVASSPTPIYAAQGQLVPQFPKGLIIDSNAAISGSYSIAYATSTNQYTAEYDSSSTVTSLFNQYMTYLNANGWTVNGSLTTRPTFDAITASQGANQLQVVISEQGGGASHASITYLVK